MVTDSILNWQNPAPEGEILAPVSLVNRHVRRENTVCPSQAALCCWRSWGPGSDLNTSLQKRLKIQLWRRHMALQMGPDNLPGYLPPGTAPFRKCWEETSQVPSCRLCDHGTRAAAMLLCIPLCFTLRPRLGYKKLQGSAGCLVFNLSNSEKS